MHRFSSFLLYKKPVSNKNESRARIGGINRDFKPRVVGHEKSIRLLQLTNKDPSRTYHIKQASQFSQTVRQPGPSPSPLISSLEHCIGWAVIGFLQQQRWMVVCMYRITWMDQFQSTVTRLSMMRWVRDEDGSFLVVVLCGCGCSLDFGTKIIGRGRGFRRSVFACL